MSVRTAWLDGSMLFVSHGPPDPQECLALTSDGLAFHLGEDRWLEQWTRLDDVSFRHKGSSRSGSRGRLQLVGRVVHWVLAVFGVLLFVLTFGGLGGSLLPRSGALEVTTHVRGRPRAFSTTHEVRIKWPRSLSDLEEHWFIDVVDQLQGKALRLDVKGLSALLEEASTRADLQLRLPEVLIALP